MKIIRLFVAFTFICLVFSPKMQAVGPEPDEANGITAEEDNVLLDSTYDTESAAMGQPNNTPNHRLVRIDFTKSIPCAEVVQISSQWLVHFKKIEVGAVEVESADLKQFSGVGKTTGRKYTASKKAFFPEKSVRIKNDVKEGKFVLEFQVAGPPNPPGKPDPNPKKTFRFKLQRTMRYTFANGKVKNLDQGAIDINCR